MEEPWTDFDFDDDNDSPGSSGPAAPPPPPLESAAVAAYVMADDADVLDCSVCCLPLKPPIFQCDVGHVVCSPCRDKLRGSSKCHSHRQSCPHAPCRCPGKDCGFIGSLTALLDHFAGTHGWPCTTRTRAGKTCRCSVRLSDGFNFLLTELTGDGEGGGRGAATPSGKYLFLLNVARQEVGRAIFVLFVGRKPATKALKCVLTYSRRHHDASGHHKFLGSHLLQSEINVECWDLSTGLPSPKDCFQFIVPDFVLGEHKDNAIQVKISISVVDLE
ncbi:hypothetical protein PR202_ga11290 [Eleusine coracana subsp. coracana]|uniref:RING-type E3 ubiquitin transferase n=1 Tax=Eleusine coracana subsp. coracana TaxID=191504 RepID=A0AAV5C8V5_ELECO|nr:hypothetical protein QOZ80_5AG0404570 [Eleusine coracana subsp. coracana]GJM94628.1 hypothetical protein PR202_ga11290 [Eleusine coracana subsp. coracana]